MQDRNFIVTAAYRNKKIEHLQMISDIAEAVRMGSAAIENSSNSDAYMDWQKSLYRRIAKLRGEKVLTVWDLIQGKSGTLN
jgi:hypothetical protein